MQLKCFTFGKLTNATRGAYIVDAIDLVKVRMENGWSLLLLDAGVPVVDVCQLCILDCNICTVLLLDQCVHVSAPLLHCLFV